MNTLSFCLLGKSLSLLDSWWTSLPGNMFFVCRFKKKLSLLICLYYHTLSWPAMFPLKSLLIFLWVFLCRWFTYFLLLFSICCLCPLTFDNLIVRCLSEDSLSSIYLKFWELHGTWYPFLFPDFGNFLFCSSLNKPLPLLLYLFPLEILWCVYWLLDSVSYVS